MVDKTRVFNRDCIDAMREFPDKYFELAIVDPPYGSSDAINPKSSAGVYAAKRGNYKEFVNEKPQAEYFNELFRVSENTIVWGGNFFSLSGGVIAWNKYGTAFGEGEVAICSTHKSVRFFEFEWNGMIQQDMKNKEQRIHPTQKPVALYKWLLKNYAKEGDKILDTHLGSGSSRIAAFDGGFEFWGYELDTEYFQASEKRFQQHKSQLKLFS
jgi:site-specific DNA-methyltransferase (adenine-specific)